MKKVVILINAITEDAGPDEIDVLHQAEIIEKSLHELGHSSVRLFLDLDLKLAVTKLKALEPDIVFNLVESLDGSGKLIHLAPVLLEHLGIPYTGTRSEAMYSSSNKTLAKTIMRNAGLRTPGWFENEDVPKGSGDARYIAKPVWEDASVGINDENIMPANPKIINEFLESHRQHRYFFEEYIAGREFNISVLAGKRGPEVLPLAEIQFTDYPEDKPRIVGYDAKWKEGSFEYRNTTRTFGVENELPSLASELTQMCVDCWKVFGLHGYARIDFRVDRDGVPWILEVNANPCLSPDAGFFAATVRAGYPFTEVVQRIIDDV